MPSFGLKPGLQPLREILSASPALHFSQTAQTLWKDAWKRGRPLNDSEIRILTGNGNACDDWSRIRIIGSGPMHAISHSRFDGQVILDWETGSTTLTRCHFRDCKIGTCEVEDVGLLERVWVENGARIRHVGRISGGSQFGLGRAIHPGSETGLRRVFLMDGWRLADCAEMSDLSPKAQEEWAAEISAALQGVNANFTCIGSNAQIESTSTLEDCFIGQNSVIHGAANLRRCVLASTAEAPVQIGDGAIVEDCVLEPGSKVESHGQARRSILLEFSGVERAGQVSDSVLGPNTLISKGEVTASLLGPFVGFHHQALLIGALWPEGCGNVGYGANVGSNHTGRKPDQEIRPGEGTFFGLACSIKFPANFAGAPYSLFATGVSIPPQRLAFPFSLVMAALTSPRGAEGLNEVLPGWMWGENAYSLIRGAYKYQDRNQSKRHPLPNPSLSEDSPLRGTFLAAGLFAPAIAEHARQAMQTLEKAARKRKAFYLERDLPGLGRNFLTRKNLTAAIAAYGNYLQIVRLLVLLVDPKSSAPAVPTFAEAAKLLRGLSHSVEGSLARDSVRGGKIFPDYSIFHSETPGGDSVCRRLRQDVETLLGPLRKRLGHR